MAVSEKEDLWDAADVAEFLKVDKETVYRWVKARDLPHIKLGRLTRFVPESVRTWATEQEAA